MQLPKIEYSQEHLSIDVYLSLHDQTLYVLYDFCSVLMCFHLFRLSHHLMFQLLLCNSVRLTY